MSTATQDRTFPVPVIAGDTLPDSVWIGGFRYDVRVADPAMLGDPKLGTFIDGLPGVFTPTPMDHGGSVWLHPDHGPDVLDRVVQAEEARVAAHAETNRAPFPIDAEEIADLLRAVRRIDQVRGQLAEIEGFPVRVSDTDDAIADLTALLGEALTQAALRDGTPAAA